MGIERLVLWCWAFLWLALLLIDEVESLHQNCTLSGCGIITNISPPFRLPHDPPNCGLPEYELACENDITLFHLANGIFRVLEIDYDISTIRLVDPGIQEGNLSSLPRYSLFRSNFSRTPSLKLKYDYPGLSDPRFRHVMYLNCSDPVREEERFFPDSTYWGEPSGFGAYLNTAPYVNWEFRGGGHIYAVVGDLQAHHLKSGCGMKMVTPIASDWHSLLPATGVNFAYADIHRNVLPYRNCRNDTNCDCIPKTRTLEAIQMDSSCLK